MDTGKDFTGTNKDDLFIADNSGTNVKASAADTLDGGKGKDTFKLYDDGSAAGTTTTGSLPTLKNIENVVIYDNTNSAGTVDLKKWDSVETLFLVRDGANTYDLGEKVTTVNLEDKAATTTLNFDNALTAATLGVNNVTGANTVTVAGTALKTLTVDASGKEMVRFDLSGKGYDQQRSLLFAELVREINGWKFNALGQSSASDNFLEWLKEYV